jgi:hypothetical protein
MKERAPLAQDAGICTLSEWRVFVHPDRVCLSDVAWDVTPS